MFGLLLNDPILPVTSPFIGATIMVVYEGRRHFERTASMIWFDDRFVPKSSDFTLLYKILNHKVF